jgi:hypothetical protein
MKTFALCLLLASTADAFTVTSPPVPVQEMASVAASLKQQSSLISATNLPSQQELFNAAATSVSSSTSLLSAATAAAPVSAPPTKQNLASTGVAITGINYDGNVPSTEADEYVVVTNASKQPTDVSGYYIYVATTGTQGPTFYFPKNALIKPNQSIRIYTNEVHMETGGYTYRSGKALWNNRGGLAVMRDANGKKICEFKYQPAA